MADGVVQVAADGVGKKIDTAEITVGANTVERQRVVLADNAVATQILSITAANAAKVDGSAVTQPVSLAATVAVTESGTWTVQPGNTQNTTAWLLSQIASRLDSASLCVTNTGAAAAAVTLTLPAVASQFHYISFIQIVRCTSALLTAAATPVLVTTTNMPGSPVFSFPADAAAQGTAFIETVQPATPIKTTTVNTATTIVCPATTAVIWRVTAWYFAAV